MEKFVIKSSGSVEVVDFEWGRLHWVAGAPQGNSEYVTVGKCVLFPGRENPKHCHPNCEEILHVLSGRIEHFVEGEGWFPMETGDTITIEQDVWHHARNVGDDEAHLLICFSSAERKTIGE
jgi:quercetin dioxygenase-like cupin family protein